MKLLNLTYLIDTIQKNWTATQGKKRTGTTCRQNLFILVRIYYMQRTLGHGEN